jgi:hypothetical protein
MTVIKILDLLSQHKKQQDAVDGLWLASAKPLLHKW